MKASDATEGKNIDSISILSSIIKKNKISKSIGQRNEEKIIIKIKKKNFLRKTTPSSFFEKKMKNGF